MTRYMVSYSIAGTCGNKTFDTPEQAMGFIRGHAPHWRSYSTFTFLAGQAVGDLTPYKEPGFNRYSWEPVAA